MSRVYISSTFADLESYRREVGESIHRLGHEDVAMEYYVAEDTRPLERCLQDVGGCDVYVGIFAFRYGFIPEENNDSRLSITELEYSKACEVGVPCLIFLLSEEAPWPRNKQDKGSAAESIEAFRERLQRRHTVNFFTTEDELTRKVNEGLVKWQKGDAGGSLRSQADWETYRRTVADVHQWVRMQVIAGISKDRGPIRIPLIDIFEPQLVAAGASGTDVPDDVRRYQEAIYGDRSESANDAPSDLAIEATDDVTVSGEENVLLASNPEYIVDIVGREPAQVILGGPGSGKSSILHYVMLRVCQAAGESSRLPMHLSDNQIPFLIDLRNFTLQKQSDFLTYIAHNLATTYDTPVDVNGVSAILEEPERSLVFFDGLDEVFDPIDRKRVITQFQTFARRYPQARIVVTSRIAGYEPTALGTAGFQHYTLLPLTLSQIRRFAVNWYRHYTLAGTDRTAQGLVQRIVESPRMLDLAGNPLLLTMMAVVYKDRDLPHERWRLYQRCAETMLEDWELGKGIAIEDFKLTVLIRTAQKSEILQRVSMFMLKNAQPDKQINAIAYTSLLQLVASYLEDKYKRSPGEAEAIAVEILKHLMEHTYVLAGIGERVFGFVHRTFMEYFAACHCQSQFNARKSDFKWITKEVFGAHWRDSKWEEVLLLLIAMLQDQGTPIYEIIDSVRRGNSAVPFRLAFAARCLGEVGSIQDSAYAQQLLGDLASAIADHVLASRKTFTNIGLLGFAALAPAVGPTVAVNAAIERLATKSLSARVVAWQMGFALRSRKERYAYALNALTDKTDTVRRGAIAALEREWPGRGEIGKHLVDVVRSDRQAEVRHASLAALQRTWRAEPAILDVLADRAWRDRNRRHVVRYIRFLASTWAAHPRARELLLEMASESERDRDSASAEALIAAGDALASGWKGDPEAFEFVISQAKRSREVQVRSALAKSVAAGWNERADALSYLQDVAVNDADEQVRSDALMAIASGWRGSTVALPFVISRTTAEQNDTARRGAFSALVTGWRDYPETLPMLREVATTASIVDLRVAALRAIAVTWHDDPAVMEFVRERAIADPSAECRSAVLWLLTLQWPFMDEDSLFFIYDRSLKEADPDARAAAQEALERMLNSSWHLASIDFFLRSRLRSESVAVRRGAIGILQMLVDRDFETLLRYTHREGLVALLDQIVHDDADAAIRRSASELMDRLRS
ncbi:DUF4062 domain-containing protein [Variovorax sp. YR216]|uniref:DUF4062 domain-containing protein n=1 Tax=Variovorax sp. YR216 TaxID=1882828 RepID=UPI000894EBA6|nr:DUF4062 domain-containing protein [Variovorax sp. YR216]SEB24330.1 NACHT domain-containing protein [Variovorax sp. YR216]